MTSPNGLSTGQRWAATVLTAFGIVGIVQALRLPFGSLTQPGPGFFPLCLATVLTVVAAVVLVAALRGRLDTGGAATARPSRAGLARAAATLGALLIYAFSLETIGFGLATFLLIAFLLRAIEPQPWAVAFAGAAATVVVCHVVFRLWLGVRLPAGPWGF